MILIPKPESLIDVFSLDLKKEMWDEVFLIQWGDQQTHSLGNPLGDLYYIVISEYFPHQNS